MNNKRAKHFDKKIILIATVVLVVLAFQMESLSRRRVREQFRCALRRIRGGGNPAATTAAASGSTAVPGPTTTASGGTTTAASGGTTTAASGVTTTAAAGTTTTVLTTTAYPYPVRVTQSCNTGTLDTVANAESLQIITCNIHKHKILFFIYFYQIYLKAPDYDKNVLLPYPVDASCNYTLTAGLNI